MAESAPAVDRQGDRGAANYIWGIADDVLRDVYVRGKYRDVILPMTVLRRLDVVLEGTRQAVLDMKAALDDAGYAPILFADRYDDRTHFIDKLLRNAEDALSRRVGGCAPRAVSSDLDGQMLTVSHYGVPFDENDVAGVCGIGKSTKDLTAIGRFGIGFKSGYALSDRPEIHSGNEDIAIESCVWPMAAEPVHRNDQETVYLIPLSFIRGIEANLGSRSSITPDSRTLSADAKKSEFPRWR